MLYDDLVTREGNLHLGNWKKKNRSFVDSLRKDTNWLDTTSDVERLYCIINGLTSVPKCKVCNKNNTKFKQFSFGYSETCGIKCSVNTEDVKNKRLNNKIDYTERKRKTQETCLRKYGVTSTNKLESVKKKQIESKIAIYGEDFAKSSALAAKNTVIEKYGVENSFQLPKSRAKAIESQRKHAIEGFAILDDKIKAEELYSQFTTTQIGNKLGIGFSNVANKLNAHGIILDKHRFKSGLEKEVLEYVNSIYSGTIISGDRSVLGNKKEIDIFIPDLNFGIEFDGLFWHSNIEKNYHLDKTEMMENNGMSLFHIFEDEWKSKRIIWESMISNKFGLSKRIYGRKCYLANVSKEESREFFNDNHMQGSLNVGKSIGLFYEDELVACLCYGKSRFTNDDVEIYRYANKAFTNVIGGFSKLLKQLGKVKIVSYANRRWSSGNLYTQCGFDFIHNTKPNYYYVKDGVKYGRQGFQKHRLSDHPLITILDFSKSEAEIMSDNGFRRIYDCGNKKFVINTNIN